MTLPLLALFAAGGFGIGACGGDDDDSGDAAASTSPTVSSTRPAGTPEGEASPGSDASPGRSTPGASVVAGTPAPSFDSNPTAPSGAQPPPSSADATLVAGAGGDIAGGDPSAPREDVSGAPTPPQGATIDPTVVAPPEANVPGLQVLLDVDASAPGIQTTRTVNEGDVFRVAIVLANASDGISAYNFYVDYDRNLAVAPSYAGGATTDRNPDLDEGTMGGGWSCLPAPEGDLDDPGGINGDSDPATGRALLSCFNTTASATGTVVLGVLELRAVASGALNLGLTSVALGGSAGQTLGQCNGGGGPGEIEIPCVGAAVTIQ